MPVLFLSKRRAPGFKRRKGAFSQAQKYFKKIWSFKAFEFIHPDDLVCLDSTPAQSQPWPWYSRITKVEIKPCMNFIYPWLILVPRPGLCSFLCPVPQMKITLYVAEAIQFSHLASSGWLITVCLYYLSWTQQLFPVRTTQSQSPF